MRVCRGGWTREHADPKTTAVPTLTGLLPLPLGKGPTAPASRTRRRRLRAECLTRSTPEAGRRHSRIPLLGSSCGSGRPLNGRVVCGSPCHLSWDPSIQPSLTSVNTRRTSVAAGESRPRWEHMLKWPGISRRQDCDRPGFWPWSVGLEPIEGRRTAESAASGSRSAQTVLTVPARHSSPPRDTAAVLQNSCCKLQRTEGPGAA